MDDELEAAMKRLETAELCVARAAQEMLEDGDPSRPHNGRVSVEADYFNELRDACREWKQATDAMLTLVHKKTG